MQSGTNLAQATNSDPLALVLDDDVHFLAAAEPIIRSVGLDVVCVATSDDFHTALLQEPDVVLVDLVMPKMDGIQILEHIRQSGIRSAVIVMTAADSGIRTAAKMYSDLLGINFLGVLGKPFWAKDLRALLRLRKTIPIVSVLPHDEVVSCIKGGNITVEYQPKIDVRSLRVTGFEALARLRSNGRVIPPSQFIASAESPDLANTLTRSVVLHALQDLARWREEHGLVPRVAINLPVCLLECDGLPDWILGQATDFGVRPDQLLFEITERSVTDRFMAVLKVAIRLRLAGFGLSIDDYGTGHSSEDRLRQLPFSEMKLDISMVSSMHRRDTFEQLRRSVRLAWELELDIVAEGVESQEVSNQLMAIGCHIHQGFHFSRPLKASDTPHWLIAWGGKDSCSVDGVR